MRDDSLRSIITKVTVATALLAVLVAAALMVTATALRRTTNAAGDCVMGLHIVEQTQISLLIHPRTNDVLARQRSAAGLERKMAWARRYMTRPESTRAHAAALVTLREYLAKETSSAADRTALQAKAYDALERLVNQVLADARAASDQATRWRYISSALGGVVVLGVLGTTTWFTLWLRRRAFKPVFVLGDAMRRFGTGDRTVRARETGPTELREMSACFNEMAAALEQQHRSQLAMLGGVAHDLRSPLSALAMSLDLLHEDGRAVSVARRQVVRLERMVGDLLRVAESARLELEVATEDLRPLIRDVVEILPPEARERIHVMLPMEAVRARVDRVRIEQVVGNLVSNALKYSASDSPVEIELTTQDRDAVISVRDHGIGMTEADRRRLFEPFRRLAVNHVPGIGLGLFVARGIVDGHGGSITVTSEPARGSTFTVRLPLYA